MYWSETQEIWKLFHKAVIWAKDTPLLSTKLKSTFLNDCYIWYFQTSGAQFSEGSPVLIPRLH